MKRFFSLLLSFITFFMTACSSPAQKTNSVYEETIEDTVSVAFEETTTIKSEEATTEKFLTTTTRKPEPTNKNTTNNSSTTEATNTLKTNKTTSSPFTTNKITTTKEVTTTKVVSTIPHTTTEKETTRKIETTTSSLNLPDYHPETEMIELYNLINSYRSENGLNKLTFDSELCKLAYIRAKEQEVSEGHIRPDGSRFFSILDEYGYSYITSGENIVLIWNNPSTRSLELWKNSDTHNKNMLKAKWTKTGIAMHQNSDGRYNIVQLFAH